MLARIFRTIFKRIPLNIFRKLEVLQKQEDIRKSFITK